MIYYEKISCGLTEGIEEIPYEIPHKLFLHFCRQYKYKFLFESKDISPVYGRLSLIGIDPAIRVSGKDDHFTIEAMNNRGSFYINRLTDADFAACETFSKNQTKINGTVQREKRVFEEGERTKQKNISQIIRMLLAKFALNKRCRLGLYGAFSYDFVRLFEDIEEKLPKNDVADFDLFLYDTFVFFDHLKERCEVVVFRDSKAKIKEAIQKIKKNFSAKTGPFLTYQINNAKFTVSQKEYESLVRKAADYAKKGELFEVVLSNILKADFLGDPFALYMKYRDLNPSPYLFFFDFGDQQLVGASPEMMVRVEGRIVHTRPISGTAKRGADPIEDHENMIALLSDSKERAELDMLIDLARNDLSRICKAGIKITDYRFVEKYSKVMHTVAHISGELKENCTAFDALIACLNAGTLTGAPKVAAMNAIERHEKERRGFYGGIIGYLTFANEMDSALIIRSAHIKKSSLRFQVGATLLFRSIPEKEYQETIHKAQAFLNTFAKESKTSTL